MRTIKILMILAFSASILIAQGKGYTKTIKAQKGAWLEVHLNPGDVVIKAGKDGEIVISAKDLSKEEIENIYIDESDNRIRFEFDSDWGWSNNTKFTFIVPTYLHLNINTTGGDINVQDNMIGEVTVKTSGGDVDVNVVQGRLSVNTSGGDIRVAKSIGDMSLNTSGGDIDVGEILGENATVNTMGGDITIKYSEASLNSRTMGGDIRIGDVGGNAKATTMGGDIRLENVSGSVSMETYGGDLQLMSATGKVQADTKGGDIKLKNVKGSVSAKTSGGEIYAELYPDGEQDSYLKSSGGDIELRVPESKGISVEAFIRIRGPKDNRKDYKIKSEITGESWEYKRGERNVKAEFNINGGGFRVQIETVNSNIVIDKIK